MTEFDPARRRVLTTGAAAGLVWATPSILRHDRVAAAAGSCVPLVVAWSSVGGSNPTFTAVGTAGTVTIQASVTANLSTGATPYVFISSSRLLIAARRQRIGDYFDIALSFTSSAGTICTASTTIVDIDQNGRGLPCATNSRFRDEITNLTGPGLITNPTPDVGEGPSGTWASTSTCKTPDTQTLGVSWTDNAGVSGAGFRYVLARPPGNDQTTLDYQLVKILPMTVCLAGNGTAPGAPLPRLQPFGLGSVGPDTVD